MRIAIIITTFPSLTQTFILNQITGLLNEGAQIDILAIQPSMQELVHPDVEKYGLIQNIKYLNLPKSYIKRVFFSVKNLIIQPTSTRKYLFRALNIFKYGKRSISFRLYFEVLRFHDFRTYDIIHAHFGPNGITGAMLRDIGAIQGKLVTTFYGYDISVKLHKQWRREFEFLYKVGDLFISLSETMYNQLISLGCNPERIVIHHLGIDLNKFSAPIIKRSLSGQVQITTIARFVSKKGIEDGVRAFAQIVKKRQNLKYTIIGDGLLRKNINNLIQELNINDKVRLEGWKSHAEIIKILRESHILLAPSHGDLDGDQEGTPVVIIEAQAMGIPVVSTWHGGIPEIVQNDISGYLVRERDIKEMANKLEYLIDNPDICTRMGEAGINITKQYFNQRELNNELIKIFQGLAY